MSANSVVDHRQPEWAHLTNFLGAYFHQDFDVEYADPWDAVLDYRSGASRERAASLAGQVRALLALIENDQELGSALDALGMAYAPTSDGYSTYRVWLTAVADYLEDPEAHPGPPERDVPMPG